MIAACYQFLFCTIFIFCTMYANRIKLIAKLEPWKILSPHHNSCLRVLFVAKWMTNRVFVSICHAIYPISPAFTVSKISNQWGTVWITSHSQDGLFPDDAGNWICNNPRKQSRNDCLFTQHKILASIYSKKLLTHKTPI